MPRIGAILQTATADPAANNEVPTTTVPAGKWWEVVLVSVSCAQGATQTPWPALVYDDGTNVIMQANCGTAAMSAATTTQCTWGQGLAQTGSAASTNNTGTLPDRVVLPPGYRVRTITGGIGANTDYGIARIFYYQYDASPSLPYS